MTDKSEETLRKAVAEFLDRRGERGNARYASFQETVVPELLKRGWATDSDGPRVSSSVLPGFPQATLRFINPADGLHYGIKDAVRVALGEQPRRAGVAKLTEPQKKAVLRCLYDPENAASIVDGCAEFPDGEESFSGFRRAVEHFVEHLREGVGR